eukprot:scaffold296855_cov19-Tisochrysis_lutea.AAC.1
MERKKKILTRLGQNESENVRMLQVTSRQCLDVTPWVSLLAAAQATTVRAPTVLEAGPVGEP